MGAFNVEVYRLGFYRKAQNYIKQEQQKPVHTESLHVARMPCPGHCGSVCPNHYCPAHNKTPYIRRVNSLA